MAVPSQFPEGRPPAGDGPPEAETEEDRLPGVVVVDSPPAGVVVVDSPGHGVVAGHSFLAVVEL